MEWATEQGRRVRKEELVRRLKWTDIWFIKIQVF